MFMSAQLIADLAQGPVYSFADWPNPLVPTFGAGVYTIWHKDGHFIYVGMSGREMNADTVRSPGLVRAGAAGSALSEESSVSLWSIGMSIINVSSQPRMLLGVSVALVSAAAFAVANSSASLAYHGGSNPLTVATARFVLTTIILIAWLGVSGISLLLTKRDATIACLLGLVTALYSWALLKSFNSIPFALAILIFYLFPLISAAIVALLGWEKLGWRTVAAIILALAGLGLALDIRSGNLEVGGVMWAFVAAVSWAVVVAVSSHVFGRGDARPLTLYMVSVAGALLLIVCVASRSLALPETTSGWAGFLVAAALYGFAIIAFFIAISMIGPVRTSLLAYADAVISAGLGVFVLGQVLTLAQISGIALVIVALIGATASPWKLG